MRLESVEINNYRQYRHVLFTFPKQIGKGDLHIIYGDNTTGKSNMLNAITWCLYGLELHLGDKNTAQDKINDSYVEDLRNSGDSKGEVSVEMTISSDNANEKIKIQRKSAYHISTDDAKQTDEKVIVRLLQNKEWRTIQNEDDIQVLIHRYLPQEINEYIFFDGEQLEKYFQGSQTDKNIKAIKGFTQADLIEKAFRGFDSAGTEISHKLASIGNKDLSEKKDKLDQANDAYNQQLATVNQLNTEIRNCKEKIDELNEIIKGKSDVEAKTERYSELVEQRESLEVKKNEKLGEMMKFTRKYFTLLALYPAMKVYKKYIDKQDAAGKLPPMIDKGILDTILKTHKCLICGGDLDEAHIAKIKELRESLTLSSESSNEMKAALGAIRGYFDAIKEYPEKKKALLDTYREITKQIKDNEQEYAQLSEYLKSIPDHEEIAKAINVLENYRELSNTLYERIGSEKSTLQVDENNKVEAEKEYEDAIKKHAELKGISAQLDYCKKAESVLVKTENNILNAFRKDMEATTFNLFNTLTWAKGKYSKIELDKDYSVRLLNKAGEQSLGGCSAAERTLLALSFTLALQKSSKHDSLLFIDTPVGRVGPENRKNFSKVLLNLSKEKQVILTFTPTEYNEDVREILEGNYSSFQELVQKDMVTEIKK